MAYVHRRKIIHVYCENPRGGGCVNEGVANCVNCHRRVRDEDAMLFVTSGGDQQCDMGRSQTGLSRAVNGVWKPERMK